MKFFLRYLIAAVFGIALLLLVIWLGDQAVRRQTGVKYKQFIEQYGGVIQQLHRNVDSVEKKMKQNEVTIPAFVAEVHSEPAPVSAPRPVDEDQPVVLQGISWNEDSPMAMISDQVYKPGDRIGRFTIQKILPQSVILKDTKGVQKEISLIQKERP